MSTIPHNQSDSLDGLTPTEVSKMIENTKGKIYRLEANGNQTQADLLRLKLARGLWRIENSLSPSQPLEQRQDVLDQAVEWARTEFINSQIDLTTLSEEIREETGSAEGETAPGQGHSATDADAPPAEEAAEQILNRIREPRRTLDDLAGESLCQNLTEIVARFRVSLLLDDHTAFSDQTIGNALFTGPPGTGKTVGAEAVAHELAQGETQFQFLPIKPHYFKNHLVGASEGTVEEVFERASQQGPTLIFIDEMESIATRGQDRHETTQGITNTLLSLLSGGQAVENVAVIGATNLPDRLDPAVKSRFSDAVVEFSEPPAEVKPQIMWDALTGSGVDPQLEKADLSNCDLSGLVGRELEDIARKAIVSAYRTGSSDGQEKLPIRVFQSQIQTAITEINSQSNTELASQ